MYIGNTAVIRPPLITGAVYPYVYREHVNYDLVNTGYYRFIPMYIGNTLWQIVFVHLLSVYPYVYREHDIKIRDRRRFRGLSLCI